MLLELKVSHFAVIDSMEIRFLRPGLNVLTGETGAGKSIVLKSLGLLMGGKASSDIIRAGKDQAVIEGAFDLSQRDDLKTELREMALDSGDDSLVIRRIINQSGKHRLYINGHLSTLNVLEQIVSRLVEITGQHEHHSLIRAQDQLDVLDRYASLEKLRTEFGQKFSEMQLLTNQIENLKESSRDRAQKMDFLRFQIQEIETVDPRSSEDADLAQRVQRKKFAARLQAFAQKAEDGLYSHEDSVIAKLSDLEREGMSLVEVDPQLRPALQSLKEMAILAEDVAFTFRDYGTKHDSSGDPAVEIEHLEERLSDIKKLQRKYGNSVEEILAFKNRAIEEYRSLEKCDETVAELEKQVLRLTEGLEKQALILHERRQKAVRQLAKGVCDELRDLNMKGAEFSIEVVRTDNMTVTGFDEVTFMLKPSPKDVPRPISKIASGGELSRLMLALKQVAATADFSMTHLFDEVDTGVSGPTAEKVGKKLKTIGFDHQVICITHLPQVAAYADAHFLIIKEVSRGQVKSQVTELNPKDRVRELGRLISGEKITASSLAHAQEMIAEAQKLHATPPPGH